MSDDNPEKKVRIAAPAAAKRAKKEKEFEDEEEEVKGIKKGVCNPSLYLKQQCKYCYM